MHFIWQSVKKMSVLSEFNHIKATWHEIRLHSCGSFQKHSNESWPTKYIAATWVGGEGGEGRRGGVNKGGRSWTFEVGFRPTELLITETASSQLRYYDLVPVSLCALHFLRSHTDRLRNYFRTERARAALPFNA